MVSDLVPYLQPTFIKVMPTADGWAQLLQVQLTAAGTSYTVYSRGKGNTGTVGAQGATTDFAAAIVFANGQFYAWPEGMQTN